MEKPRGVDPLRLLELRSSGLIYFDSKTLCAYTIVVKRFVTKAGIEIIGEDN